jgi:hypothetical protein
MISCARCLELVGPDALGALDPSETRLVREHVASCPACAAERERLAPLPALLDLAGDPVPDESAPASLRQAVLDGYARDSGRRRARGRPRARARRAVVVAAAVAAAAAAVLGVLAGTGAFTSEPWSAEYELQGTAGAPAARGTAHVWEDGPGLAVRLRVDGLPSTPAEAHYEMWLVADGPPVSAGAFRVAPDGSADVNLRVESPTGRFSRMGVSLEPDARDPVRNGRRMLEGRLEDG